MDDACPLCHTEVTATHRVGGPKEETPNAPQSERGRCQRGHDLGVLLTDLLNAGDGWSTVGG
jgi:hypothetical protein